MLRMNVSHDCGFAQEAVFVWLAELLPESITYVVTFYDAALKVSWFWKMSYEEQKLQDVFRQKQ